VIRIEQRDSSVAVFPSEVFWKQLFLAEVEAAVGIQYEPSEVTEALQNATPEAQAEIKALIATDGGDFLRRGLEITGELLVVSGKEVPDLSDA